MNNDRRKQLADIRNRLEEMAAMRDSIRDDLDSIKGEEQEVYDNMPESFQNGDKGEKVTAAVDAMQELYDGLDGIDFDEFSGFIDTASE